MYEAGDLEVALEKGATIVERAPDSAAAHSVVALVQEKLADRKFVAADFDGGVASLKQAIAHYERILQINPYSEADRAKLISLRKRLVGPVARPSRSGDKESVLQWIKGLSLPVRAGAVAFLCALVLFAVALAPGSRRGDTRDGGSPLTVRDEGAGSGGLETESGWKGYGPQDVYTYRPPSPAVEPVKSISEMLGSPTAPKPPASQSSPPASAAPILPFSIKPPAGSADSASRPDRDSATSGAARSTVTAPPAASDADDDVGADDLFKKAMTFRRQGQPKLAVAAAEKAISLYQQQIARGKDVETAQIGIENARKLIDLAKEAEE